MPETHEPELFRTILHHPGGRSTSATPVVFVNSLATTGRMWDGVVQHLDPDIPTIRYDQRDRGGHGDVRFSLDDLVDDLFEVLDRFGTEHAHVAGVSLGGLVALRAAMLRPGRVRSVTAMCCAARFSREVWLDRGALVRRTGIDSIVRPVMDRWFTPEFQRDQQELLERYRQMFVSTDIDGYAYACDVLAEADIRSGLPGISAPTLVVSGAEDTANPVTDQELIAHGVPGSRHVILSGIAHLAPVSAPAETARLLFDHMRRAEQH